MAPDFDTYISETANLAKNNPLNRRSIKKDAKRARKAARRAGRNKGGGMEVDEEQSSLAFTFMATPEGVVV
jgi:nuclear GTP-binding protein